MGRSARVRAQAKVNLFLRVLAREASGYHSLETLFLRLDLADDVTVRVASGQSLDCAGPALLSDGLGPVEKNLAFRAARAYAKETGWPDGFAIEIVKRIPVGGGLGGGSADAGGVLRALDALSPRPLGSRLAELAAGLGADVPFLAIDSPMALAWGRGERLHPVPPLDSRPVLLVVADFPIATADAYGWLATDRGVYAPAGAVLPAEAFATWEAVAGIAVNEFEPVVSRRHPVIGELVSALRAADAVVAMLAGSGSTVFAVFDRTPDPARIAGLSRARTLATRSSERVYRVECDE